MAVGVTLIPRVEFQPWWMSDRIVSLIGVLNSFCVHEGTVYIKNYGTISLIEEPRSVSYINPLFSVY